MNTKLFIPIFLAVLSLSFIVKDFETKTEVETNSTHKNISDSFLIGAMHDGTAPDYEYIAKELGLNLWHRYITDITTDPITGRSYPAGLTSEDLLYAYIDNYKDEIQDTLNKNMKNNMWSLIQRPKIEWLCYGQRSDYQCEKIDPYTIDNWFYSFQKTAGHKGLDYDDGGTWVKSCTPETPIQGGMVVSRLKANTEQCHRVNSGGNEWVGDSFCDWYIKPRVKADVDYINGNPDADIFRVIVLNEFGDTIKDVIIKSSYFYDDDGDYDEGYIEEFFFPAMSPPTDLKIHGDWGQSWGYKARGEHNPDRSDDNHADIQIYWYGTCEVMFDYVRVDNDVAHNLLSTDVNNTTHKLFDDWIQWEAKEIACANDSPLKFYIELPEYNNLPCIAYVCDSLRQISQRVCGRNINVMTDLTNTYSVHVSWDDRAELENAVHIKNNYIDKIGATQIFMESYPFTACYGSTQSEQNFSVIPNTLPSSSGDVMLAKAVSPSVYDSTLQENLDFVPYQLSLGGTAGSVCTTGSTILYQDIGNFRYRMDLGDTISKMANIPFIYMPQSHLWYREGEVRREPTIEEMALLTNLSLTYGARGNILFAYNSEYDDPFSLANNYCRGLFETSNLPRTENVYGQPKWDTLKRIVDRLKKWGPYLMRFDNCRRHTYIYRLERDAMINETFFQEVYSYKLNYPSGKETKPETTCDKGGWKHTASETDEMLCSISFGDSTTGFKCGAKGKMYRTMDAGLNWDSLNSGTGITLRSISFINGSTGIAAGDSGMIIKTLNGGLSWGSFYTGKKVTLLHNQLIDPLNAFCVGVNGRIVRSMDGGMTWDSLISPIKVNLNGVYFVNQNSGYISGDSGTILFTSNGGNLWLPQNSNVGTDLNTIFFTDVNTGYAAGKLGVILKTTNGGNLWTPQFSGTKKDLNAMNFKNANIGTLVGADRTIIGTLDGGTTYEILLSMSIDLCSPAIDFHDVDDASSEIASIVGDYGINFRLSPGTSTLCINKRYLQVATFKDTIQTDTSYFMIVNRRCSPMDPFDLGIESGLRYIEIELETFAVDFGDYLSWKIIDVENDIPVKTFDKSTRVARIELGWFNPGEGKLYKIVPVPIDQ